MRFPYLVNDKLFRREKSSKTLPTATYQEKAIITKATPRRIYVSEDLIYLKDVAIYYKMRLNLAMYTVEDGMRARFLISSTSAVIYATFIHG